MPAPAVLAASCSCPLTVRPALPTSFVEKMKVKELRPGVSCPGGCSGPASFGLCDRDVGLTGLSDGLRDPFGLLPVIERTDPVDHGTIFY